MPRDNKYVGPKIIQSLLLKLGAPRKCFDFLPLSSPLDKGCKESKDPKKKTPKSPTKDNYTPHTAPANCKLTKYNSEVFILDPSSKP